MTPKKTVGGIFRLRRWKNHNYSCHERAKLKREKTSVDNYFITDFIQEYDIESDEVINEMNKIGIFKS